MEQGKCFHCVHNMQARSCEVPSKKARMMAKVASTRGAPISPITILEAGGASETFPMRTFNSDKVLMSCLSHHLAYFQPLPIFYIRRSLVWGSGVLHGICKFAVENSMMERVDVFRCMLGREEGYRC